MMSMAWSTAVGSAAVASTRAGGVRPADAVAGANTTVDRGAERAPALHFAPDAGAATVAFLTAATLS